MEYRIVYFESTLGETYRLHIKSSHCILVLPTSVIPLMAATVERTCLSLRSLSSQMRRSRSGSIVWQGRRPVVRARISRQARVTTKLVGVGQSDRRSTVIIGSATFGLWPLKITVMSSTWQRTVQIHLFANEKHGSANDQHSISPKKYNSY